MARERVLTLVRVALSAAEDIAENHPGAIRSVRVGTGSPDKGPEWMHVHVEGRAFDRLLADGALTSPRALRRGDGWEARARYDSGWDSVPPVTLTAHYESEPLWWHDPVLEAELQLSVAKPPSNMVRLQSRRSP